MRSSSELIRHTVIATALAAQMVTGIIAGHQKQAQRTRSTRIIQWADALTIAEQLRPNDEVVIVKTPPGDDVVKDGTATPERELASAVQSEFAHVLLAELSSTEGILAMKGRWVQTKMDFSVIEVLKVAKGLPPEERLAKGRPFEVRFGSGEIQIGQVTVRAGEVATFPIHRKYLLFLDRRDQGGWYTTTTDPPLLLTSNGLLAIPPTASFLTGLTLDDVRAEIRRSR